MIHLLHLYLGVLVFLDQVSKWLTYNHTFESLYNKSLNPDFKK